MSGTDAIVDVPPDRWRSADYHDPDIATPGKMVVRQGGFLRSPIDEFDAGFFGMSPREADALDPQQRLLLEVTWEALEDAGIPPSSTAGTAVGAYIGGFTGDAAGLQLDQANQHLVSAATPMSVSMTMLSARLSYVFDWRGPSATLDTACSSSLVALHQACVALDRGECDLAVAGGVNVMINPAITMLMSKGQFLSPDARCKAFDHRANGYVRAEGVGVLVLKPLPAAVRDGDRVHAVVLGTAVNQDGRTPGITVPSASSQRAVIREACRAAGVEPGAVDYFEAHGTGTPVGDPIEASAIGDVLAGSGRSHWMGSVKTNIGHTEAASGVAGVIKASLCLTHGQVPPNLHFQQANPAIPFDKLPVRVPTGVVSLPVGDTPPLAGVNSFGFGGTNAHAVLQQAPPGTAGDDPAEQGDGRALLLPLSARSGDALRAMVSAYADLLDSANPPALADVCRAAAMRRDHLPLRTFVVADSAAGAASALRGMDVVPRRPQRTSVAFVYTGMGPQWWGMGRELLAEPRFAEVVADCDEQLARFGLSIGDELRRDEATSRLTETLYAQVANFVVQAGLTALWRDWGVEPALVTGHSVGEVAAAYAAGVYTLEDAITVSYHRANLQARLAGRGVMAAVPLPAEEVTGHLVDGVDVAAVNSAHQTTISGNPEAVRTVLGKLAAAGVLAKPLRVEVAYHSGQMDEIRDPLYAALAGIRPRTANVALYSTVTASRVDGPELTAEYWWHNVRRPVLFAGALRELLADGDPGVVLEIGPHPVLATAIDEALAGRGGDAVVRLASQRRDRPSRTYLMETLGRLYAAGVNPAWDRVHPGPRRHVDLPAYPWQRVRHWTESDTSRTRRVGEDGPALRGRAVVTAAPTRDTELFLAKYPYLADHRVRDAVVFPGSGYLEVALATLPGEGPHHLEDVTFRRPLVLAPSSLSTLRTSLDPGRGLLTLHSREPADDTWTLHADMRVAHVAKPRIPGPHRTTLAEAIRSLTALGPDEVYPILDGAGLHYGPAFRAIDRLWCRPDTREITAELRMDTVDQEGHRLHPALLDAALHAMIAGALHMDGEAGTFVPQRIDTFRYFRPPGRRLWVHGKGNQGAVAGSYECDLSLTTDDDEVVAELRGLRARRIATAEAGPATKRLHYLHSWLAEPRGREGAVTGEWILVGSSPLLDTVARSLSRSGGEVTRVDPGKDGWLGLLASVVPPDRPSRVVFADVAARLDASACARVDTPLELARALPASARLVIVTAGTQRVGQEQVHDPFGTPLWGFARVLSAERPELRCRLVDLPAAEPGESTVEDLIAELGADWPDEIALRAGGRYVRRLAHADDNSATDHLIVHTGQTPVRLKASPRGLEELRFLGAERRPPGPAEVEIEVTHVGLNFKDVLKLTGLLPQQAMEGGHTLDTLGLECSGRVVRAGSSVTDLHVGDAVFTHSRDLFASYVTVDAVRVVPAPEGLSGADAATFLPVVTAHLSLTELARVRAGDRVLVHSGAGGVGLAAVRIARSLGAEVYATAGSEARREFLRREGVAHVADSRSTSFVDDVLDWTGGDGVDVVINSLPGEMIQHSLSLLRPFGRFVELGKPGEAADQAVRLATARRSLSFHSFDYDHLEALHPERVRQSMRAAADLVARGEIRPLPVTELPAGELATAFRTMMSPGHVGKIVIRMAGEQVRVPAASLSHTPVRADATYLITGGLGGLGRTVATWLADRGARHLVLVGRSGVTTAEAERAVAALTARGVEVRVEKADVADRRQLAVLLDGVRAQMPPLRGVLHAAADFADSVIANTVTEELVAATRPKADGAWNLHLLTQEDELDLFVLFSSAVAQLGLAGAAAYTTANEFLHGLARHRSAAGLLATSVGWGLIDEVGVSVRDDGKVGDLLRRNGNIGMSPARLVSELDVLARTGPAEVSVADIDWTQWARANPQLARLPMFGEVVPPDALDDGGPSTVTERLLAATSAERLALLPGLVAPVLQRTTGLTEAQLHDDQPIDVDSLTSVELRVLLQKETGLVIPAAKLQRTLSVSVLTALLDHELTTSGR